MSYKPDPEAQIINAFTVSWQTYLFYAFPPFSVLALLLQKVQEEQSTGVLVVLVACTNANDRTTSHQFTSNKQNPNITDQSRSTSSTASETHSTNVSPLRRPFENKGFSSQLSCPLGDEALKSNSPLTYSSGNNTVVAEKLITFQPLSKTV